VALAAPGLGRAPWPPTYQERLQALRGQLDGLATLLAPLHEAHRAFEELGGGRREVDGPDATRGWKLPLGASLGIQAGFRLRVVIGGDIARGCIPPPDPLLCLASALCDAEQWATVMAAFAEAAAWAVEQAREWNVSVPGFD
jgi:hypothetical protein